MPINKRESLLFTFIMCFCMVLWMSIYNVALQHGAINGEVVAAAWLGFPVAYVFAMCCDWFIASPPAKGFAFKFLVTPGKSSPLAMTLAVSSCMVVPMVIIMSLYGACEGLFHMPGGPLANLQALPMMWLVNIPRNFIMALPWNLLVAGPVARFVFRRAFPMGTVFAEPHMELVHMPGAPAAEEVANISEGMDVEPACWATLRTRPPNRPERFLFCRRCRMAPCGKGPNG